MATEQQQRDALGLFIAVKDELTPRVALELAAMLLHVAAAEFREPPLELKRPS